MEFSNDTFTHALCTFGIFIMSNGLAELHRVTKPGGFVGVSSWVRFQWYIHLSSFPISIPKIRLLNICISPR
jgi:ubiquinone/menaquinone biosynthesis C-methylase UbiE